MCILCAFCMAAHAQLIMVGKTKEQVTKRIGLINKRYHNKATLTTTDSTLNFKFINLQSDTNGVTYHFNKSGLCDYETDFYSCGDCYSNDLKTVVSEFPMFERVNDVKYVSQRGKRKMELSVHYQNRPYKFKVYMVQ